MDQNEVLIRLATAGEGAIPSGEQGRALVKAPFNTETSSLSRFPLFAKRVRRANIAVTSSSHVTAHLSYISLLWLGLVSQIGQGGICA